MHVLQSASIVVPLLGLGWAILRYEFNRYAKAHPNSRLVKDGETVVREGQAVADALGITSTNAATVISGYLTDHGMPATANAVLTAASFASRVGAAAKADAPVVAAAAVTDTQGGEVAR
ncbi:hypothetical protein [Thiomonas sp.]